MNQKAAEAETKPVQEKSSVGFDSIGSQAPDVVKTTSEAEQVQIFENYCKFLNAMDVEFKVTINNKNRNMNMKTLREKPFLSRNTQVLYRTVSLRIKAQP